jgi:uncharacterized delta-60 repeat protein
MAGDLDITFDGDGKVTTDFGIDHDQARGVAIQSDGKIMVAGYSYNGSNYDFALTRYNANGSLDTTFDGDGKVTTAVGSSHDEANSVAIQSDGKIVVAGSSVNGGWKDFALARYNTNGSPDTTFDGDGKVTTSVGSFDDYAYSVAIQSDGKIVIAGVSSGDFALVRYNSNGSLDTTFDFDGKVTTAVGSSYDYANSVTIQSDGKIVVAGSSYNGSSHDFALARYNSNGSLDTIFDGDGKITTAVGSSDDEAHSVAIQSDGKIVVAGYSYNGSNMDFAVARYNSNGSLDTTFDGDGKVTTDLASPDDFAYSVAIQSDGKIVAAGFSNSHFALSRYNSNGSLDTTFDFDGKVTTDFGGSDVAYSVAIQSDGKIVVAGESKGNFALARYHVSEAPTDITLSPTSIAENSPANTTVGTLSTIDPDAGDTFSYSLVAGTGDTDNSSFNISGNSLRATSSFDFETKSSYTIRIRSTDQAGLFTEKTFTISVTNVNEAPTEIAISFTSISENAGANAVVGALSTTDPDVGNTFTYTLVTGTGDTDNASFNINGSTLQATSDFNFETKSSYTVRVRSTDQNGLFVEKAFAIQVVDVNEAPWDIQLSSTAIAENAGSDAAVSTLSTTDADAGNSFVYSLFAGEGDMDNAAFTILGATLRATNSFDFESKSSYAIRMRSTDQGGLFYEKSFLIRVTDVNESPTDISLSSNTIAENSAANTPVGTLSTTDPDAGNTFTYALVTGSGDTDNVSFNINGSTLRATSTFDFETNSSYTVRIRSTDQNGLFVENAFAIQVVNANEPPTDIGLSWNMLEENAGLDTTVGTFSTPDVDAGNTFTYSLVTGVGDADNVSFRVVGSDLVTISTFDFETKLSYFIRVRSTDQGGLFVEKTFVITVIDVNEAPTDISLSSNLVAENAEINTPIGPLFTADPDAGNSFTYTLVAGSGDADNATFNIAGSILRATNTFNFETKSSYTIRVRSTDQRGLFTEKAFTINVTDVNEAPTDIALSDKTIAENAGANAVVGTLSTADLDAGNTFTYSFVSGTGSTDNGAFNISGSTLRASSSLDFETKSNYTIRIRSTDQDGLFVEKAFVITVSNTNESPNDIRFSSSGPLIDFMINGSIESPSVLTETQFFNGLTIGSGWTVISGNTAYVIPNSAGGGASPFGTQFLEIHGDTVGQLISGLIPGVAYTLSYYVTLASNSNYFGVGQITASIAGQSDIFDYSLFGNHLFGSAAFPWRKRSLSFTATSSSESLVISGTGAVNQNPFVAIDNVSVIASIPENMGANAPIGVFESTDPDIGSSLIYSLVAGEDDADNTKFIIDGATLRSIANLDFESKSKFSIRVRATDQGGLFTEESFTIHLTNVNEEPTDINLSATSIPENSEASAIVGTLSTLDVDAGDTFSYSLVAGTGDLDNNAFTVTGSTLRATSSFDFETRSDYTVRVRSTDQGGLFVEKVFAIRVVNANEAPVAVGDSYWISVDTFKILDVLANDSDVDSAIDPTSIEIFSPPLHGTATPMPDGTVRYTPNAGYRGAESFTYRLRDSLGLFSNAATVQLRVNSAPNTNADSLVVKQTITTVLDVLRNDSDPDGTLDPATLVIVSGSEMADVMVQDDGTIRFTPRAGFLGTTQFRYLVSDNNGRPSVPTDVAVLVVVSIYQNPRSRFDVDDDGSASPLDVLVLINLLNSQAPSLPVDGLPGPPAYVDVNADNRVDPLDVLDVINHINSRGNGEGEGNAAFTFDDVFAFDDWHKELRKSNRLRLTRF